MVIIISLVVIGLILFFLFRPPTHKEYPVITAEMFDPPDVPITLAKAKQFYRKVMLETGHLDKQEVGFHADHFSEEIKDELQQLKEKASEYKADITTLRGKLKTQTSLLNKTKDEYDREDIESEIESITGEIEDTTGELDRATAEHKTLQSDKKQYLIDALNNELHGNVK